MLAIKKCTALTKIKAFVLPHVNTAGVEGIPGPSGVRRMRSAAIIALSEGCMEY